MTYQTLTVLIGVFEFAKIFISDGLEAIKTARAEIYQRFAYSFLIPPLYFHCKAAVSVYMLLLQAEIAIFQ